MAGGNHPKGSSNKPSSSSASHRKSRWESGKNPSDEQKPSAAGDSKPPPPQPPKSKPSSSKDIPQPKPGSNPSPSHPKPPSNPDPRSVPGPSPSEAPFPFPFPADLGPPPAPAYGFHMLDRRTIVLADGSVRSYFALPPDYQDFAPQRRPVDPSGRFLPHGLELVDRQFPQARPMSPGFRDRDDPYMRNRNQDQWNLPPPAAENLLKRKYIEEGERGRREEREGNDEFARQRQQLLQYGNAGSNPNGYPLGLSGRGEFIAGTSSPYRRDLIDMGRGDEMRAAKHIRSDGSFENFQGRHGGVGGNVGLKHNEVDQDALKKAFLHYAKMINETETLKKKLLADWKQGPLQCVACGRSSKDFPEMHDLIMHTYNPDSVELRVDHLGLHKALCILMGWNYLMPPDSSKAYQVLSAHEAAANQDDLIMWPPVVIIHNTNTGKGREGRMEGLGNKAMDNKLRELGFGGKSKSLYGREGHLGITLMKFAGDQSGLKEAVRLAEFFEKDNHGRRDWAIMQSLTSGKDENNPNLVKVDKKTGEKERIFYGYLGTVSDLDNVDPETRKKVVIESMREYKPSG